MAYRSPKLPGYPSRNTSYELALNLYDIPNSLLNYTNEAELHIFNGLESVSSSSPMIVDAFLGTAVVLSTCSAFQ